MVCREAATRGKGKAMIRNGWALVAGILFSAAALAVTATQAQSPAPAPYAPGLGDFMTAYVQPHHTKLWFAGAAGNWDLAAYEADELDETFDDVKTYSPTWKSVPVARLVGALLAPSLKQVKAAIAVRNVAAFKTAYGNLTASCNACHTAAGHGFIRITVPTADPYADQNLTGR
jgi:hypothetical protein